MMTKVILDELEIRDLPQTSLASYLGMTKQAFHYRMQVDSWTLEDAEKVATFFGITLNDLIKKVQSLKKGEEQ